MAASRDDETLARALTASLESARAERRLLELPSFAALAEAAAAFIPAATWPRVLAAPLDDDPGAFYGLAVVPSGPGLEVGDWRAGPVTLDGRDGVVILLVVSDEVAHGVARSALGR